MFARVRLEPVLVGGVLLAVGEALVNSASWKTAVPAVVAVLVRRFVSPVAVA